MMFRLSEVGQVLEEDLLIDTVVLERDGNPGPGADGLAWHELLEARALWEAGQAKPKKPEGWESDVATLFVVANQDRVVEVEPHRYIGGYYRAIVSGDATPEQCAQIPAAIRWLEARRGQ